MPAAAKSFLDRVFKPPAAVVDLGAAPGPSSSSVSLLEIVGEPLNKGAEAASQKPAASQQTTFSRLVDFKETLRQRMKAKRQQIRAEEEEDELIDEEYHPDKAKHDDDEASKDSKASEETGLDDDEDGGDEGAGSDEDFKLNLNDDDDEEDAAEATSAGAAASKKGKSEAKKTASGSGAAAASRKDCYDFDSDSDSEDLTRSSKDKKSEKSKTSLIEIPSTNSIPSNQLTKSSALKSQLNTQNTLTNSEFESLDDENTTHERLYLETIPFENRRSIDEMTNISFNYESNNQNTTDSTLNSLSLAHNSMNQSGDLEKNEDEEVVFDELAMLCSGQFRATNTTKKTQSSIVIEKLTTETVVVAEEKEKAPASEAKVVALDNQDLYDAGSDCDEESKSKTTLKESEATSKTNVAGGEEDDTDEDAVDGGDDSDVELVVEKKAKVKVARVVDDDEDANDAYDAAKNDGEEDEEEEEEEEGDEGEEEEAEEIVGSGETGESEPISKEDFFEKEAELSGSEADSDENDDGESDIGSLLFSGDEDELPSDSDLKDQLGKIYLKDQLDRDKKEIRMFKEMYLMDGEMHQDKGLRRKQFHWKSIKDERGMLNHFSSDEDDEDDEEDDEEAGNEGDEEKMKDKSKRFAKTLANRNWRSVRHEREEFVKNKALNADKLLSDDEDENGDSSNSNSGFKAGSHLLKKGQKLLKQTITAKVCQQQKRSLNGEVTTTTTSASSTTVTTAALSNSSPNRPPTKSSITIEKVAAAKTGSSPSAGKANNENLLSKFSFLNRDKSYLNRISSYVNKNFYAEGSSASSKAFSNRNNNNMVFASIDVEAASNGDESSNPSSKFSSINKKASNYQASSALSSAKVAPSSSVLNESAEAASAPKRTRYEDTCESIFNHIN